MSQKVINNIFIQIFDFVLSMLGLIFLSPVLLILYLLGFWMLGSPIYKQERIGKNKEVFTLVKFRTMDINSPSVPTHLISTSHITPYGKFLRKTKLDELPQLWNVLKGQMSLVGPRPGLPGHEDLITARERHQIFLVKPGITGLAQINNIDMSDPTKLAEVDKQMIDTLSLPNYFHFIFKTIFRP